MRNILVVLYVFFSFGLWASHNQAGEIVFEQLGNRTVKITLITYTKVSSQINRDSVNIKWGDNQEEIVLMNEGYPKLIGNFEDTQISKYTATHTYGGAGSFTVSFEDPFRNAGIRNIVNSAQVFLTLQTTITISPFLGSNISPVLLNPPLDRACIQRVFEHNPAAFDTNNDSLYYSLTTPKGENGNDVTGYTLPNGVSVNSQTGTFSWDSPQTGGQYNFAIKIEEFRNGFKLGEIIRDMQVNVSVCNNLPPTIEAQDAFCVWAGNEVEFAVKAQDLNEEDLINLSATGGVFEPANAPIANFGSITDTTVVENVFKWQTACNHIFNSPHQVVFRAVDNNIQTPLSSFKTVNITVVAPPTPWDTVIATFTHNQLNWQNNFCTNVLRYDIYRSNQTEILTLDSCFTGLPTGTGYQKIGESTTANFTDNTISPNNTYCYRLVAVYPNFIQSVISDEYCVESKIVLPYFTKISVEKTSENLGEIAIHWRVSDSINQIGNTNNLFYQLYQIQNNTPVLIYQSTNLSDTSFIHSNINTLNQQFNYQIVLKNNLDIELKSSIAQNPFIVLQAQNQSVDIRWNMNVPWQNDTFYIYQQSPNNPNDFIVIDSTANNFYMVKNITNNQEYCFKIQSKGQYKFGDYLDSIVNYSQIACITPQDIEPPCIDTFFIASNCIQNTVEINWKYQNLDCDIDWQQTKIYKYLPNNATKEVIFETTDKNTTNFTYSSNTIVGCYAIELIDTINNSSGLLLETCVNSCAILKFPNYISINNDGINDFFEPIKIHQINKVELKIYNRWGVLLYQTNELPIQWDGTYSFNSRKVSAGVYYYICTYYYTSLNGEISEKINGFIQISD
jgi:gliding motility-associated-like protein